MTNESATGKNNINKEIIEWGSRYLSSHGYILKSSLPEIIQETPWSYVIRFETSDGYIYLKQTPKMIALEAIIIQVLRDQFNASVPTIIAKNAELNCFLMKDAGKPLRSILKQKFDELLLFKAIDQFTSLQIATGDYVGIFLDLGVPDWRLDKIPDLYKELLSKKEMLLAGGLTEIEITELDEMIPQVVNECERLSSYSIKQTIVQPDFNDNNNLVDETLQSITIIDLGEISISHPFFSLINCLYVMKKHHALKDEDGRYQRIKNAYLEKFEKIESNTSDAFEIANMLFFIYEALGKYRLIMACDEAKFTPEFQRHRQISIPLRQFIIACKKRN